LNVILDKVNTIMTNITGPSSASTAGEEKKV
jgi:hypothetical protein